MDSSFFVQAAKNFLLVFATIIFLVAGSVGFVAGLALKTYEVNPPKQQLEQAQQQVKQSAMSPREILDNLRVKVWLKENGKCLVVVEIDNQTELLQCVEIESGPKPHYESTNRK